MSKKIKEIQEKLSALQDMLNEEACRLDEVYESRSEKWQDSEKGEEWKEKSELLNEAHDYLDNCGGALLQFLGEL